MKTKIFIILCGLFMLSSLAFKAHSNLTCNGNGGCYYTEYHYDAYGTMIIDKVEYVGFGCVGTWIAEIDRVVPSGHPVYPEVSASNYAALANLVESNLNTPTAAESAAVITLMNDNPSSTAWVNPFELSADAYNIIYGDSPYYDIFYVYTSTNISTGAKMLNLYSDDDKMCTVIYKNIMGTIVASENVSIVKGSNYKTLTVAPSLPSGYYTLQVISPASEVTTSMSK